MFLVKSGELASVFSSRNKPVFNVEDVEKYGFGAIPECSGRIGVMLKCVQSILSRSEPSRILTETYAKISRHARVDHLSRHVCQRQPGGTDLLIVADFLEQSQRQCRRLRQEPGAFSRCA